MIAPRQGVVLGSGQTANQWSGTELQGTEELGPALLLVHLFLYARRSIPYLTINLHVFRYNNNAFE